MDYEGISDGAREWADYQEWMADMDRRFDAELAAADIEAAEFAERRALAELPYVPSAYERSCDEFAVYGDQWREDADYELAARVDRWDGYLADINWINQ